MENQNPPTGPYDPTEHDVRVAAEILDAIPDPDPHFLIGVLGSCLDAIAAGRDHEQEIRRARAAIAEFRKRRYGS